MRRLRNVGGVVFAAALLALAFTGCGEDAPLRSTHAQARTTAIDFMHAYVTRRDAKRAAQFVDPSFAIFGSSARRELSYFEEEHWQVVGQPSSPCVEGDVDAAFGVHVLPVDVPDGECFRFRVIGYRDQYPGYTGTTVTLQRYDYFVFVDRHPTPPTVVGTGLRAVGGVFVKCGEDGKVIDPRRDRLSLPTGICKTYT